MMVRNARPIAVLALFGAMAIMSGCAGGSSAPAEGRAPDVAKTGVQSATDANAAQVPPPDAASVPTTPPADDENTPLVEHSDVIEHSDVTETSNSVVDYARNIRPLLASRCYACHGPDKQEGGVRLDLRQRALAAADSGDYAIVPGKPDKSQIVVRITTHDQDLRMPQRGEPLSAEQVDLVRRWIAGGAEFGRHWADVPPIKHPLPRVRQAAWPRGPLDYYVLARIEAAGLTPNEEADRYHLVRRLYLDLIGLPPSPEEVDAFVADERPDAYERLVDRLLASPRFGQRWARWWLDLARYADTNGYESDEPRSMWPYRDWVVGALNENMPFDRFTILQLAGDLLPDAGIAERIPTGFHRCSLINTENGAKDDEFRDAANKDRLETTATVWLAATIGCAQCHNHKYDPYTQADYYRLYDIFNDTTDKAVVEESDKATVNFADLDETRHWEQKLKEIEALLDPDNPDHAAHQREWEAEMVRRLKAGEIITPVPPTEVIEALPLPVEQRSKRQTSLVNQWYRKVGPRLVELHEQEAEIFRQLTAARGAATATTMVMMEGAPQPAYIQIRGDFLKPGEQVHAGVPDVFGVPVSAQPVNRLVLARWLVDPRHPRTSRVTVNRLWDVLFGAPLVSTSDDFGAQGEPPVNPELLDWLAVEFVEQGWDIKRLLRTIVVSATYRQSSRISAEQLDRDRYNDLLARGARYRVEAEMIRDIALEASGLLVENFGGPSVFPPQPAAVMENLFIEGGFRAWPESEGADRYRRGLYTFVKRTALHPELNNFDAPNRITCTVHRKRSNTPSAALNTLNGTTFVEASAALARRMAEHEGTPEEKIVYGYRLCATRLPQSREVDALLALYQDAAARFETDPAAAHAALVEGRAAADQNIDEATLAAWMAVANTLLNMDATITRG